VDADGQGSESDCNSTDDAYSTIQAAIADATADDTISVCPGTYVETGQIVINKDLSIVGADKTTTIIKPAQDTGSSGDAKGWFLVNDGITFNLSGVTLDGTGRKVWQAIRHLGQGTISDCAFENIKFEESGPSYAGTAVVVFGSPAMNVDVTGCTFSDIGRVGVLYYGSGVTDSTFSDNTYTGKDDGDWLDYAVEVGAGARATITDNTISGNTGVADVDGSTSAGILVTTYYGAGTQATISGNDISGCTDGIGVGYDASDTSVVTAHFNNLTGNATGISSTAPAIDAEDNWWGNTNGPQNASNTFNVGAQGDAVSDNVDFVPWLDALAPGGASFAPVTTTDPVGSYASIQAGINASDPGGTVNAKTGTYNENVTIDMPLILQATSKPVIDGGAAGDAINVSADGVTIDGFEIRNGYNGIMLAGVSSAVISNNDIHDNVNVPGSAGAGILFWGNNDNNQILNNVIHDNDRQGLFIGDCDFAGPDWACTVAGTTISTGNIISGNTVYDNGRYTHANGPDASAYGIQLWNADSNTIGNNEVYGQDDWEPWPDFDFAQGIYLTDSNNNTVTGNYLHDNNYGVGIYSPDRGSSGGNHINLNSIAGNTGYGVMSFDANLVDATGNWWDSDSGPTHTLNPGGTGDAVGDNVAFSPWLGIGTDSSGDIGFQPASPMTFIVEPQVCLSTGCIQQAIDLASAGDTISVYPGTYDEDEANDRNPNTGEAGSDDFNIFVNKALTIQGVDALGDPIADYADVAAYVSPKRNTGGGHTDTIFVQADDVIITGLDVAGWTGLGYENNKTLESIGDNLTVKYNKLHGMDGAAALYMYDPRFDPDTDTSYVQSYLVEANLLDGGGTWGNGIRISSGPGWGWPVSGRLIKNNTFDNDCDGIEFVGPGGDTWDVYPVGAATIEGNKFSRSDRRHVVAWGEYKGDLGYEDPDWEDILKENSFDKGAVTRTSEGEMRSWETQYSDESGTHVFKNIVGIYSGIQRYAVTRAVAGDTVEVLPGTYDEQVVITKSLTLQGAGSSTIIKPSSDAKLTTVLDAHYWGGVKKVAGVLVANVADGSGVTVKNLKVDGQSVTAKPAGSDFVAGVFYRETAGTIDSVTATNVTVGATGTAVRGYGIFLSAGDNTVSVEVKYSTVTNYDKNGIEADGSKLTANIHDNTVTGRGPLPEGDEVQNGILIGDGTAGTVNGNTVTNNFYTPETWWGAAVLFFDAGGSADGNIISGCQIGVIFQDGDASASGNTVAGGKLGVYAQSTKSGTWTASFADNTVSGSDTCGIGGATYAEGASLTLAIDDNALTGGTGDGVCIGDLPEYGSAGSVAAAINANTIAGWQTGIRVWSDAARTVARLNSISGNTAYGARNTDTTADVDARSNWWGDVTGPYHPTKNPGGLGDDVSDYVLFDAVPDNCPTVYNPDQKNTAAGRTPNGSQIPGDWASNPAQDKLGDACDPDDDNDALPDTSENESVCPFQLVRNSDGDRVLDGFEVAIGYNPCSDASKPTWEGGGDSDGDGFPDGVERTGYNTCIFAGDSFPGYTACINPADSDGDGCEDWIEIVDVNGNRAADIVDILWFAKRAFDIIPASDSDYVLDINKNGAVDIVDVLLAAQNSTLLKPHSPCGSEG
jgi:parallel beta-helix repeat protein